MRGVAALSLPAPNWDVFAKTLKIALRGGQKKTHCQGEVGGFGDLLLPCCLLCLCFWSEISAVIEMDAVTTQTANGDKCGQGHV